MTRTTLLGAGAALAALMAGPMQLLVHAQRAPSGPRAIHDAWADAVRKHLPGQFDASAVTVAGWPPEVTRIAIDGAMRVDVAVLAKGLVLHTDIAIVERNASETGPAKGGLTVMLLDGTALGPARRSHHWTAARRLADALAARPGGAPIARTWYRAAAAVQQHWGELGPVRTHLQGAVALFPDDPVLALYVGTLHQGQADPRLAALRRHTLSVAVADPAAPESSWASRSRRSAVRSRSIPPSSRPVSGSPTWSPTGAGPRRARRSRGRRSRHRCRCFSTTTRR